VGVLGFSLAFIALVAGAVKCVRDGSTTGFYISGFSLFYLFEAIDLLVPGMLVIAFDLNSSSPFQPLFSNDEKALALVVASVSFLLFMIGYSRSGSVQAIRSDPLPVLVNVRRLIILNVIFGGLVLIHFANLVYFYGGVSNYIESMSIWRYGRIYQDKTAFDRILDLIGSVSRFASFVLISNLYCFRHKVNSKLIIYGALLFAICVSLATFYRGTLLLFFLMLASAEQYRIQNGAKQFASRSAAANYKKGQFRKLASLSIVGVILFTIYGALRSFLGSNARDEVQSSGGEAFASELGRLIDHGGFYSLTHILSTFDKANLLYGESIYSTLFFRFIPRNFWPSKPLNYGAYDINNVLGYPGTTQAAITIPGELFANFGLLGVGAGMLLVGYLLSKFQDLSRSRRLDLFHTSTVASLVISIGWFSTTGFSSWLYSVFVIYFIYISRFRFVNRRYN